MVKGSANGANAATERGRRMLRTGIGLIVFGVFVGLVLMLLAFSVTSAEAFVILFVFACGGTLCSLFGGFLVLRGKQHVALGKSQARIADAPQDAQASVIYLRSFSRDESGWGQTVMPSPFIGTGLISKEEQLADVLAPIGEMVAIGRPGETLPKPGATRAYADDDEWQQTVNDWLCNARLVVLRAGSTEGLWWETIRAFEILSPGRILILLLGFKRTEYDSFAGKLRTYRNISLPDFDGVRSGRRVSGFFEFGHGWNPRFLPLRVPFWRASLYKPLRRLYHQALQSVFLRLGVDWRPPPISAFRIVVMGLIGLTFLLFLFALLLSAEAGGLEATLWLWPMMAIVGVMTWVILRRGVRA